MSKNQTRINLNSHSCSKTQTECFVIERDVKEGQISASVIVKNGTLKVQDVFVCGNSFGRIKYLKDDKQRHVSSAKPGESVFIGGLRQEIQVGCMLYGVENIMQAEFIVKQRKKRQEQQQVKLRSNFVSKKVGKLTRRQKRAVYSGDTSIITALLEGNKQFFEKDCQALKNKYGSRFDEKAFWQRIDKKMEKCKMHRQKQWELRNSLFQGDNQSQKLQINEQSLNQLFNKNAQQKQGIFIKAKTAGALEALIKQITPIFASNKNDVCILGTSVGSQITQKDLYEANECNASIFGFDIDHVPQLKQGQKCQIKVFKLLHNMREQLQIFCNKAAEEGKSNSCDNSKYIGEGKVQKIYQIKDKKKKGKFFEIQMFTPKVIIAGLNILSGKLSKTHRFRVLRNGQLIANNLQIATLKQLQSDVQEVAMSQQCGIQLKQFNSFEQGDIIQGYQKRAQSHVDKQKEGRVGSVEYCD